MHYNTSCSCGQISVSAFFPSSIEEYQARRCDCDFCVSRGLEYLSDVNGTISFSPKNKMNQLKQGSDQAIFWECNNCQDVVAVTNSKDGETRGALVKALFGNSYQLKPSITVSPKKLSPSEKTERWLTVWSKVI